jgi:2-C-methyl-D-erythritol 4-phosphate cytidylyltransferase
MESGPGSPAAPGAILPLPAATDPAALFAAVAGEEPLVTVVRTMLARIGAERVVVAVPERLVARVRGLLAARGWSAVAVVAAAAPGDRRQALAAGLQYLVPEPRPAAPLLVFDHRHPLVPAEVTDRVVAGLRAGHRIVVPVLPVTDSVKSVDGHGAVVDTIDRATLRSVQYPRGFTASALAELLAVEPGEDELGAVHAAGLPMLAVDGHRDAARFTLPADADLLAAIIMSRR